MSKRGDRSILRAAGKGRGRGGLGASRRDQEIIGSIRGTVHGIELVGLFFSSHVVFFRLGLNCGVDPQIAVAAKESQPGAQVWESDVVTILDDGGSGDGGFDRPEMSRSETKTARPDMPPRFRALRESPPP